MNLNLYWKFLGITVLFLFFSIDLTDLSSPAHQFCIARAQNLPTMQAIVNPLVCGKKPPLKSSLHKKLTHLGLIHVFVVSGAHLFFIKNFLKFFLPKVFIMPLLFFYILLAGAQPPLMRAFVFFMLLEFSEKKQPCTPSKIIISVLITFIIYLGQSPGFSLAMSWVAISTLFWCKHNWTAPTIYLTMLPLLLGLQVPHPASILVNIFFAPFVFVLLMPTSFLCWLLPVFDLPSKLLWVTFEKIMNELTHLIPPPVHATNHFSPLVALIYAFLLHTFIWLFHIHSVRQRCAKSS